MSVTIGLAEAKARLSEVVDRVEAGEIIIISRNGSPAVEVRPLGRVSAGEAIRKMRAIAKRVAKRNAGKAPWPPHGKSLREIAHERHRF